MIEDVRAPQHMACSENVAIVNAVNAATAIDGQPPEPLATA
jgi:hypothetical protein